MMTLPATVTQQMGLPGSFYVVIIQQRPHTEQVLSIRIGPK
jgi:hypothetical protein